MLLEFHDEWQIAEHRSLSEGSMARLALPGDDGVRRLEVDRREAALLASRIDATSTSPRFMRRLDFPTTGGTASRCASTIDGFTRPHRLAPAVEDRSPPCRGWRAVRP